MYAPQRVKAKELERVRLGFYEERLLTDMETKGSGKYLYVFEVQKDMVPCYYISSEENAVNHHPLKRVAPPINWGGLRRGCL